MQRPWPTRRPLHGVCRCGLALLLLTSIALGGPPSGDDPPPTERGLSTSERVRLVLLPTAVTTRRGKPVRNLESSDFVLTEEGEPREIDLFATEENAPIALAFLLDVSGSMELGDRLGQAKRAIRFLVKRLDPADRIGLIRFADRRVEWVSRFGDSRQAFAAALNAQVSGGKTALYDALVASASLVGDEERGRKAIVLITDGADNASSIPRLRATWMARRVSVPIYTLSFIPIRVKLLPYRLREALRVLERFSTETGGSLFPVHADRDLDRAARRIDDELRFQYLIGFYPSEIRRDGAFRRLGLTTTRDGARVRSRRGYYPGP